MTVVIADDAAIEQAAQLLRQGRLVAFPTETVYGLGADAGNAQAVACIFKAKGRPADHPLIVHIADSSVLGDWAQHIPDAAYQLAEQFWPGPLAMILAKQARVPSAVTGGQQTVGLRVPNHPVALALLQRFGGGVAAPSANRFCRISPTQAAHVAEELGDSVAMILDGGSCQVGVESTIIDLSGAQPRLLRPGHISSQELAEALQTELVLPIAATPQEIRAPGMMDIHYAPTTPALLCPATQLSEFVQQLLAAGKSIGLLTCRLQIDESRKIRILRLPEQADAYAQRLYAALRELDSLGLDVLVVEQPPQSEAWQAINDRLQKATVLA
ncbi:MAG: L-threonylcarbamoyladenylate synthase [Methylococcales bacterium]